MSELEDLKYKVMLLEADNKMLQNRTNRDRVAILNVRHLIKLLKAIRHDSSLWKKVTVGAADMYLGMPLFCREIDIVLKPYEENT